MFSEKINNFFEKIEILLFPETSKNEGFGEIFGFRFLDIFFSGSIVARNPKHKKCQFSPKPSFLDVSGKSKILLLFFAQFF